MRVFRSVEEPIRQGLSTLELWQAEDHGLIACWERGREMAIDEPEIAQQAREGVLLILPWKGGVDRKMQGKSPKVGTYRYLATWQGLRGENLDVDTDTEIRITCTAFGQDVLFTDDFNKYAPDTG